MANDASNVAVGVTGAVYRGTELATAPTTAVSPLTGFDDLGYVSEDGVTQALPSSGDAEVIRAWQNGAVVRTIRTPSEDKPTFTFTCLETKIEVIEAYYNATVDADGSFVYDAGAERTAGPYVIDIIDGDDVIRKYVPRGVVTELGDQVYANGEAIGYEMTVEAERDDTLGGNFREWSTRADAA